MGRNKRGAFYAPADDSVHLNISSVARGDVISTPYAVGIGFKGETDEENIRIIRDAIDANTPVVLTPDYGANQDY